MKRFSIAILALSMMLGLMSAPQARAELKVCPVLSSNMVLQREKPIPVWGEAEAGKTVTVRFGSQKATTKADAQGKWMVTLKAMPANAKPQKLTISSGKDRLVMDNVLVGEVWIAGGQSNMEFNMGPFWNDGSKNKVVPPKYGPNIQQQELERANLPLLRQLWVHKVHCKTDSLPADGWTEINPETLPTMSAVGYFFGKNLVDSLQIPVGIITSCWGGSRIESWTPEEYYLKDPVLSEIVKDHKFVRQVIGDMWKGMIAPMAPFALRGVIWYQGESQLTANIEQYYRRMEPIMMQAWRDKWNDPDMAFYCVELAPYIYTARRTDPSGHYWYDLPKFRQVQIECLQDIPHSGMAVTVDLCDNPEDIHPTYKWEVGRRLALQALNKTYGWTSLLCEGPTVKSITVNGDEVRVTFETNGRELVISEGNLMNCFTLGTDQPRFYPVTELRQEGNTFIMRAKKVDHPCYIRFGWDEAVTTNLRSSDGLAADQFELPVPY